ncbi:rhodanese-like domain-containing protein [Halopseudomonas pelagia]|uniref:rhodanese-like domain-containing protein n=1 Tax=Halopseudomonas pelagia TaxID=553151 RepID=UPI0003A2F66E|nr:rhodanese-like domain-containing protein [Halopseudomonas pelagia]|tara:strand:+ start:474 stop:1295 length:822 start_codon:yes stop_codon:yes gene_type:complete
MPSITLPLLIEPQTLSALLDSGKPLKNLRLVDLSSQEQYLQAHVPGAVHLAPSRTSSPAPRPGLLPELSQLEQLFGELGHHPDLHYVVYDDEGGGWAGRFIWILDSIGHCHYSYLNGGIKAWQQDGLKIETQVNQATPSLVRLTLNPGASIDADELKKSLAQPDFVVWDARSPAEYRGEKVLAERGGHIPGAVNFEWTAGMDTQRGLRLRNDLREQLQQLGLTPDKNIVTHCQTHHRSGFTYLAAKILGYPRIRAYAGSWSEWGNLPDSPIEH